MISTHGRYALRVLLNLARAKPDQLVSLEAICADQNISKKYLESIVRELVRDGFLIGQRGKNGGYRLAKRPEEIMVLDILESAEGGIAPVSCLHDYPNKCERCGECETLPLWEKFYEQIRTFFGGISLLDVINKNY